jgi:hypothetical protein
MILLALSVFTFAAAAFPAILFARNLSLYREPPLADSATRPKISVLVPARNEENSIARAVESALGARGVDLEVLVMDDASTDRTAEVVRSLAAKDARVRLYEAPQLPEGWNGKQHACWNLALLAQHETLCFLDADVELAPDALARMSAFLRDSNADLASGFPREIAVTFLEWLLLPLIHFVLLGFLPISSMRRSASPAYSAGCGQFMLARREPYFASGGHAAIRTTMHDGLLLPRLFRKHGHKTDLADLTALATCRMYRSAEQVWQGLSKNATEGLAAPARIVPATALLLAGQVFPFLSLSLLLTGKWGMPVARMVWPLTASAALLAYLPRVAGVVRFRQSVRGALLHPVGIVVLLALQWVALGRKLAGKQAVWKQRPCKAN